MQAQRQTRQRCLFLDLLTFISPSFPPACGSAHASAVPPKRKPAVLQSRFTAGGGQRFAPVDRVDFPDVQRGEEEKSRAWLGSLRVYLVRSNDLAFRKRLLQLIDAGLADLVVIGQHDLLQ
jgi:hypothetical protein